MDKYLMVVMMFLITGIPMSFLDPTTGRLFPQPIIPLFYASIGGIIIIVLYNSFQNRKERKELRKQRRKSKK